MTQKLILPVNNCKVTVSYKWGNAYAHNYGGTHYGMDMYGNSTVYAMGAGTVMACGWDNVCGNVVAIQYNDVVDHVYGGSYDVIVRYYHLASIRVKKGQVVTKDTAVGIIGSTGTHVDGIHLHLEIDKDTQYPCYTPTLSRSSNLLKKGLRGAKDTTIDPRRVLHCKVSAPDRQSIAAVNGANWVDPRDAQIPKIQ